MTVRTWDRNAIRISTGAFGRTGVRGLKLATSDGGSVFTIRSPYGNDGTDLELMVPATSPLEISGTPGGDVTIDGDVTLSGIESGDVTATVPREASVTVSVETFDGELRASFPVTLQGDLSRRFRFSLGGGSARMELETLSGEIFLIRPGESVPGGPR